MTEPERIEQARAKLRRVAQQTTERTGVQGNAHFLAAIEDPTDLALYCACHPEYRDILRMALCEAGVPLPAGME